MTEPIEEFLDTTGYIDVDDLPEVETDEPLEEKSLIEALWQMHEVLKSGTSAGAVLGWEHRNRGTDATDAAQTVRDLKDAIVEREHIPHKELEHWPDELESDEMTAAEWTAKQAELEPYMPKLDTPPVDFSRFTGAHEEENPNYHPPDDPDVVTLYHDTDHENLESILEQGLQASGWNKSVWFNAGNALNDTDPDWYSSESDNVTIVAKVPRSRVTDVNEQGVTTDDIPPEWIQKIVHYDPTHKSEGATSVGDFSAEYPQPLSPTEELSAGGGKKRKRHKPIMRGLHLPDGMYSEDDCEPDEMLARGISRLWTEKSGTSQGAEKGWEKRKRGEGSDKRLEQTAKTSWMSHAPTYTDEELGSAEEALESSDLDKIPSRRVSVAISRIIPNVTQGGLDEESVKKYVTNPTVTARGGSKLPQAYRYGGKIWLIDGHHRVEAAHRRGEENVDLIIHDFDQIGKSVGHVLNIEVPVTAPRSIRILVTDFFRASNVAAIQPYWRYGVGSSDVLQAPAITRGSSTRQSIAQVMDARPLSLFKSIAPAVMADRLDQAVQKSGDKPGHVFHGNQWTHGESVVVSGVGTHDNPILTKKDSEEWDGAFNVLQKKVIDAIIDHKVKQNDPRYAKALSSMSLQAVALHHAQRSLEYGTEMVIFASKSKDGRVQAVCSFYDPPREGQPWSMAYMASAPWNNHHVTHLLKIKPEDKMATENLAVAVVKTALEHNVDLAFTPASEEVAKLYTMLGAHFIPDDPADYDPEDEEKKKPWEHSMEWDRDSMREFLSKHEKSDVGNVFDEPVIAAPREEDIEEKADTTGHPFRGNQYKKIPVEKLPADQRVWQNKTEWGSKALSKNSRLELGGKGEFVAAKVLETVLHADFSNMNEHIGGNSPIDLLGDTSAVEVKSGKTTNGRSAQHWRITHGQPGVEEKEKMAEMSAEELHEYNQKKTEYLVKRKLELTDELSKKLGKKLRPTTIGVIFDPRMKRADLYVIPGFHAYLPWSQYATDKFYIGTVNVPSGYRSILDIPA